MRVRVHPHRTMVNSGVEACVSVTPVKRHGRAYYMGTVHLRDVTFTVQPAGLARAQAEGVRNVHALAVGELTFEAPEQFPCTPVVMKNMQKVIYHFEVGRFLTVKADRNEVIDVTDGHFAAAIFVGRDFYVSKVDL